LWTSREHNKLWISTNVCKPAKIFLSGPDRRLLWFNLKILVCLLTGYIALKRHLTVIKIRIDPRGRNSLSFLGRCGAYMIRYFIFGAYLIEVDDL